LPAEREEDPYAVTSGRHDTWNADLSKQQQHSRELDFFRRDKNLHTPFWEESFCKGFKHEAGSGMEKYQELREARLERDCIPVGHA